MTTTLSPDGGCQSVLVTPEELASQPWPADSVVVVVSDDCLKAVDATREAQGRHGIFVGSTDEPAAREMQNELYEFKTQ